MDPRRTAGNSPAPAGARCQPVQRTEAPQEVGHGHGDRQGIAQSPGKKQDAGLSQLRSDQPAQSLPSFYNPVRNRHAMRQSRCLCVLMSGPRRRIKCAETLQAAACQQQVSPSSRPVHCGVTSVARLSLPCSERVPLASRGPRAGRGARPRAMCGIRAVLTGASWAPDVLLSTLLAHGFRGAADDRCASRVPMNWAWLCTSLGRTCVGP